MAPSKSTCFLCGQIFSTLYCTHNKQYSGNCSLPLPNWQHETGGFIKFVFYFHGLKTSPGLWATSLILTLGYMVAPFKINVDVICCSVWRLNLYMSASILTILPLTDEAIDLGRVTCHVIPPPSLPQHLYTALLVGMVVGFPCDNVGGGGYRGI